MAVWLVLPPTSVAKPFTRVLSSRAVWLGQHVVGNQHDIGGYICNVVSALADEAGEQLPLDIMHVLDAFGEIAIGHLGEDGAYFRMMVLTAYSAVLRFLRISLRI